ncbi:MAG: glycosyltransferase family 2 protein, partial [Tepidisphaeraceae bacterium]
GIELSIFHLSTLSRQLLSGRDTARFLAGTNYFVDPRLMIEVGAWNDTALVEDAELGLRLYLRKRVKPAWLSCHEVEQTPPDAHSYFRQRRRWALGHFQLLSVVRASRLPWHVKAELYCKLLHSVFMCPLDVGLPILGWTAFACGWGAGLPRPLHWMMLALLVVSLFVWDYFGRGMRILDRYAPARMPRHKRWLISIQFILAMPWLMVLQAAPRFSALYQYLSGRYTGDWQKTPRTVEIHDSLPEMWINAEVVLSPVLAKSTKTVGGVLERAHA